MEQFITFEGIEGCGKTSQIKLAGAVLRQRRVPYIATEEPGGTPMGRGIRRILLNKMPDGDICTEAEILLFSAARECIWDSMRPAMSFSTFASAPISSREYTGMRLN